MKMKKKSRGSGWMCTLNGSYCENENKVGGSDQGLGWGGWGSKV